MADPTGESSTEAPTLTRYLVSFVLLPGAIVAACLAIVVAVRSVTFSKTTPEELVDTLEQREGRVRWRAAAQLSGALADPEDSSLRQNRQIAMRLAEILRRELNSGGDDKDDVMLRVFLCRALGEFELDVSLPVLVAAAGTGRNRDVRRSAIEAISLLADALGPERARRESRVVDSLLAASRDGDAEMRLTAAYALGVLGGEEAEQRLTAMLLDDDRLVRFNAATGLARWGSAAAIEVLVEMLSVAIVADAGDRSASPPPELIQANALEAVAQIVRANPAVPTEKLREAIDRLEKARVVPAVRVKIAAVKELLDEEAR